MLLLPNRQQRQLAQADIDHLALASQKTFSSTKAFNSNIQDWDTSSVTKFRVCGLPLLPPTLPTALLDTLARPSSRDKCACADIDHMTLASQSTFELAKAFNSNIQDWDTSSVLTFAVRGLPLMPLALPTARLDTLARPNSRDDVHRLTLIT